MVQSMAAVERSCDDGDVALARPLWWADDGDESLCVYYSRQRRLRAPLGQ